MATGSPGPGRLTARLAEDREGVQLRVTNDVRNESRHPLGLAQVSLERHDRASSLGTALAQPGLEQRQRRLLLDVRHVEQAQPLMPEGAAVPVEAIRTVVPAVPL